MKKNKTYTTLLEIGAEGGSITINKMLVGNQNKYWFTTEEYAMADLLTPEELEGIELHSKSAIVDSFEEAFALAKKKYPIFKLYLRYVDDKVKVFIAKEYSESGELESTSRYRGSNWRELLGFEKKY